MPKIGWALIAGLALVVAVTVSFTAGATFAGRHARAAPAADLPPDAPPYDTRSIALAKLLIVSLREGGAAVLSRLPQATADDERHPGEVKEKVVRLRGEVRDLRFDDGLFVGTLVSRGGGLAYFVTPIAVEGMSDRRDRRFRGVPIALAGAVRSGEPGFVVIGAFEDAAGP